MGKNLNLEANLNFLNWGEIFTSCGARRLWRGTVNLILTFFLGVFELFEFYLG